MYKGKRIHYLHLDLVQISIYACLLYVQCLVWHFYNYSCMVAIQSGFTLPCRRCHCWFSSGRSCWHPNMLCVSLCDCDLLHLETEQAPVALPAAHIHHPHHSIPGLHTSRHYCPSPTSQSIKYVSWTSSTISTTPVPQC